MPPASNEEQFKFLISCIRYSNNGKVDFAEVARECGVVSKGAAAKRYERMMKAHGIYPGAPPVTATPTPSPAKSSSSKSTPSKKRKTKDFEASYNNGAVDDDDDGIIQDVKEEVKPVIIKDEASSTPSSIPPRNQAIPSPFAARDAPASDPIIIADDPPASDEDAGFRDFFKVEDYTSDMQDFSGSLYD